MVQVSAQDRAAYGRHGYAARATALAAALGGVAPGARVLAAGPTRALVATAGGLQEATYRVGRDGAVSGLALGPTAVRAYGAGERPARAAADLRWAAAALLAGEALPAGALAEVAAAVRPGEAYWMGDVLDGLDAVLEAAEPPAHVVRAAEIRAALWGRVREIEAAVPATRWARAGRVAEQADAVAASWRALGASLGTMVDSVAALAFPQDDATAVLRDGLVVEARALRAGCEQAAHLGAPTAPWDRVAQAHDRVAGRARTLAVVAAWIAAAHNGGTNDERA
jgi:hypothetical protein